MKVSLDFHDFSVYRNRMDLLLELKEHYPELKVSMFTIPFDYEMETAHMGVNREENLQKIKDNLDWIQIIPHGLTHLPREFEKADRNTMVLALQAINDVFEREGLPYEKGFCAPYWLWNKQVVQVLNERGWWGAVDVNQPDMLSTKRFYRYSHSTDEEFWKDSPEVLKLHGHMTLPSPNNLEDTLSNLLKLPSDVEWHFVTDFIEEL